MGDIAWGLTRFYLVKPTKRLLCHMVIGNYCHLIISVNEDNLAVLIRDFKKHTSKVLINAIEENEKESRREWLKILLQKDGKIWF